MPAPWFDPSKVENKISLHLTDDKGNIICTPKSVMRQLAKLLNACVEGGGFTEDGLPMTYVDEMDPYVLFTFIAFIGSELDVSTTILIRKVNMYLLGYLFSRDANDKSKKWQITDDMVDGVNMDPMTFAKTNFSSSYAKSGGKPMDIDYEVGVVKVIHALLDLRNGSRKAFIILCHILGEMNRFIELANFFKDTLKKSMQVSRVIPEPMRELFNDWEVESEKLHKQRLLMTGVEEPYDNRKQILKCVKKESPLTRIQRMKDALQKHGKELKKTLVNKPLKELNAHEIFIKSRSMDTKEIGHVSLERGYYQGNQLTETQVNAIKKRWKSSGGFEGHVYEPPKEDRIALRTGRR